VTCGGWFSSQSPSGRGIYATASANSGTTYGGFFSSDSPDGYGVFASTAGEFGVYGQSTATGGTTYGGFFESDSSFGRGIYGAANATGAADTPFGVRGSCSTATLGFAVYAAGDMGASGVKPFRIDHPFDPENKYLLHYSAESPFPQNFYSGNVVTDAQGRAWVELPEYFAEINANVKYQLTVVDDTESPEFVQAKIGRKIQGNRFLIMTSAPNVEVSWRIEADRNDLRVRFNRPTDERQKTGPEKGKYQHPEYYGLPASMGMDYLPASHGRPGAKMERPGKTR
jgi:hypothetical protein